MESVFIIAEAGVNHNGDRDIAFEMVEAAAGAGVDAVKFQTFNTKNLVTMTAPKAAYQSETTDPRESQFEMLQKLELNQDTHRALKKYTEQNGLQFLSTAFDLESLAFLSNDLQLEILKIPSGEVTNGPLLLEYGKTGRELILSTGMANLDEIRKALAVLAFGLVGGKTPSINAFSKAYESEEGQAVLRDRVMLLHCTTQYPAPIEVINLRAMATLRDTFHLRVGYSDHSQGIIVPCTATALGAVSIEKHFTLDCKALGPDHSASLEPMELKQMVEAIRAVQVILGDGDKTPRGDEMKNREIARKSLVAAQEISEGEHFSQENMTTKRPGTGRSPMSYWSYLGNVTTRPYRTDELID
jgi:N-acetylneuraminate synthase